jgi:hypothetical protein
MPVRLKTTTQAGTIADAISAGFGELQSLRDEMGDWKDNLEEKLSHTEKYSRVEECHSNLDEIAEAEDECVPQDENYSQGPVTWPEQKKSSKKSPYPRWLRLSNATAALGSAKDAIESIVESFDEEMSDEEEEAKADLQANIDKLEEVISIADSVDFPGMYG